MWELRCASCCVFLNFWLSMMVEHHWHCEGVVKGHWNAFLQLLHNMEVLLLQYNSSSCHLILSSVIKQTHLSAFGNFLGKPRYGRKKWFNGIISQAIWYPGLDLRMPDSDSSIFQMICQTVSQLQLCSN